MRTLLVLLLATFLAGCASRVVTSTTTFHGEGHSERGSIAVLPVDDSQERSLEFDSVRAYVLDKLIEKGYSRASNENNAQYVAFITYGIDDGTTRRVSAPIFGQTSGGTSYQSGTMNIGGTYGNYSSTTTTMPTFGIVGTSSADITTYKREVFLKILKRSNPPKDVYEVKAISSGSCGNVNSVIREIIDAMFENFPGDSGRTKRVSVDWQSDC